MFGLAAATCAISWPCRPGSVIEVRSRSSVPVVPSMPLVHAGVDDHVVVVRRGGDRRRVDRRAAVAGVRARAGEAPQEVDLAAGLIAWIAVLMPAYGVTSFACPAAPWVLE